MKKFLGILKAASMNILTAGMDRGKTAESLARIIFLNAVTLTGGITLAVYSSIAFSSGNRLLALATAICAAFVFLNFFAIRLFKLPTLGGVIDAALIFALYLYLALSGGESGSGVLWSMTYPLITLFLLGPLVGTFISLAFGAALGLVILHPALNVSGFSFLYSLRVLGSYFFIWIFALIYELVRKDTQSKLISVNAKLQDLAQDLRSQKKQSDDILGGVEEGIFLLSAKLELGAAYSRHLERIFERADLSGARLLDILLPALSEQDGKAATDYLGMLLEARLSPELLSEINPFQEIRCAFPLEGGVTEKFLRISFIRVGGPEVAFPILAVARDVSDEVLLKQRLATEEREHRRSMESLFQIIHVDPFMLKEFVSDTEAEFESVNAMMRQEGSSGTDILASLFQSIHAVKGNAILLGLKEFGLKVHDFENAVKDRMREGPQWRDLLSLTLGLAELSRELDSLKSLISKILSFQTQTGKAGLSETSLFQLSLEKMVKREAERTGIQAAIEFSGFDKRGVPEEHRRLLKDVMVQLIRNSFAHGIEPEAERAAANKSVTGRLNLALEWEGRTYCLRYRDDGRGLDPAALRRRALSLPEFAKEAAGMDSGSIAKLIFRNGFSTTKEADLGSGRGVGLAFVMQRVLEAKGKISLRSSSGKFVEFSIRLPLPEGGTEVDTEEIEELGSGS